MQRTAMVASLLGLLLVSSNAVGQDRPYVTPTPCEGLAGSDAASCEREWQRGVNAEAKAHGITPEEAGQRSWLITLTYPKIREIPGVIPFDKQGPVWLNSRGDGNLEIGVVSTTSTPEQEEAIIRRHLADVFPDPQTAAFVSDRLTVYSVPWSHNAVLQTYARLNSEIPGWPVYSQVLRFGVEMHEGREYVVVVARPSATAAQLAAIKELTAAYAPIAYAREARPEELTPIVSKVGRKRLKSCGKAPRAQRCRRVAARSLPRGAVALSVGVTSPETKAIATLAAPGQIKVRVPGVVERLFAVPDGCQPQAMAPGSLFMNCWTPTATSVQVLDPVSGSVHPVTVGKLVPRPETYERFRLMRAGRYWLYGEMDLSSDNSPSALAVPVIVSRATGAVIDLTGQFTREAKAWGSRRFIDLSSRRPDRRLCSSVRRSRVAGSYGDLVKLGDWTLRETQRTGAPPALDTVQRCGSPHRLRLGERARTVLGRGVVAWFHSNRELRVRNLRSGRTRSYSVHGGSTIAFSANRLVVSQRQGQRWLVNLVRTS